MDFKISEVDFYIVDNGSSKSEVWETIAAAQKIAKNVIGLRTEKNLGFGGGIKFALQRIPNDFVGWMPGNYKIRPADLIPFLNKVELNSLMNKSFKAIRVARGFSSAGKTHLANMAISIYFKSWLFDTGGTPTIISREYIQPLLSGPNDYSFEAYTTFLIRKRAVPCLRIPIPYHKRPFGKSHWQAGVRTELNLLINIMKQKKVWKIAIK